MYSYMNNYQLLMRQTEMLVTNIEKAIKGEYSAIHCYDQIAKMASNEEERKQILEIQKDDKRHLENFMQIYTSLTGRQHHPPIFINSNLVFPSYKRVTSKKYLDLMNQNVRLARFLCQYIIRNNNRISANRKVRNRLFDRFFIQ